MTRGQTPTTLLDIHGELLRGLRDADNVHHEARVGIMNQMAEAVIENGGMTVRVDEFALAMHGIHYRARGDRTLDYRELYYADDEEGSITHLYDNIEKSTTDASHAVMMHNYGNDHFAIFPEGLRYPQREKGVHSSHPLRFTIERNGYSFEKISYLGKILLPTLSIGGYRSKEARPDAIQIARFVRDAKNTEAVRMKQHPMDFRDEWHVGSEAIVSAAIHGHIRTIEQDKAFLDLYSQTTQDLGEVEKDLDETAWEHIWAKNSIGNLGAD